MLVSTVTTTPPLDWNTVILHAQTDGNSHRREAWAYIYRACRGAIRVRVRARIRSGWGLDVDDIVQDVILLAEARIGQFISRGDPFQSLQAWLCTLAQHHVVDLIRRRALEHAGNALLDRSGVQPAGDPTAPRLLAQLLDGLSEEDGILARGVAEEKTFPEIAQEILALRRQNGLGDDSKTLTAESLEKRWKRLRDKISSHGRQGLEENP